VQGAQVVGSGKVKRKRANASTKPICLEPNRAIFNDGRTFRINYDTPANITALLVRLVKSPNLNPKFPPEVLQYEVIS
jgi:hypothetical protein